MAAQLAAYVSDDPETNAVLIVRATSIQFALSFFTSLTRPDSNAALAMLGLYAAFYRKKDPCKLVHPSRLPSSHTPQYMLFLVLSLITDFIWMIIYGDMVSAMETIDEGDEDGYGDDQYPVGTCKLVLALAAIQFIIKAPAMPSSSHWFQAVSTPFAFKLQMFLPEEEDFVPSVTPYDSKTSMPGFGPSGAQAGPNLTQRSTAGGYESGYQGNETDM